MGNTFVVIGYILIGVVVCFFMMGLIFCFQYVLWFHNRKCKHCNHSMEYKGLREDAEEGHFLFHCTHCGAWEQVPRIKFSHDMEKTSLKEK